jgi:DNA primase
VPRISDADVVRVRERTAIDQVVGETVTLRRAGGGSLKGLCPFHDEKSPSFTVRPEMGVFHCFGCGKSGDVITFVREVEALSFVEAVERLAARAGVTLTYEQTGPAPGPVCS